MNYIIEGNNSPVLTVYLGINELLSVNIGSEGWYSPHICEIRSSDNIFDALKNGLSEDRFFSGKYTSCAENAEITLVPDFSPCTIYPAEITADAPLLISRKCFLALSGGASLTTYISKTFGDKRFELCETNGSGTLFAQIHGSVIKRELYDNDTLIIRAEQLAACSKSCSIEIYEDNGNIMLKITNGEVLLCTAKGSIR